MTKQQRIKQMKEDLRWVLGKLVAEHRREPMREADVRSRLELLPYSWQAFKRELKRQGELADKRGIAAMNSNPDGYRIQRRLVHSIERRESRRLEKIWPLKLSKAGDSRNDIEVVIEKNTVNGLEWVPICGPTMKYKTRKYRRAGNGGGWGRRGRIVDAHCFTLNLPPSHTFDIIDGHLVAFKRADRGGAVIPCTWWRSTVGMEPDECPGQIVNGSELYGIGKNGAVRVKSRRMQADRNNARRSENHG